MVWLENLSSQLAGPQIEVFSVPYQHWSFNGKLQKVHGSIDHVNGFDSVDHMTPSESLPRYHFQELKSLLTARPNHPAFLPLLSSSNGLI